MITELISNDNYLELSSLGNLEIKKTGVITLVVPLHSFPIDILNKDTYNRLMDTSRQLTIGSLKLFKKVDDRNTSMEYTCPINPNMIALAPLSDIKKEIADVLALVPLLKADEDDYMSLCQKAFNSLTALKPPEVKGEPTKSEFSPDSIRDQLNGIFNENPD